jgi:hypothetical protein
MCYTGITMTNLTNTYQVCASRAAGSLVSPAAKQGLVMGIRFHQEAKPNTSLDSIQRQWITH